LREWGRYPKAARLAKPIDGSACSGTRPCAQSMRLLVALCPDIWGSRKVFTEEANRGANWCAGRMRHRFDLAMPYISKCAPEPRPKAWCAVTSDVLLTSTTPRLAVPGCVPQQSGRERQYPCSGHGRCHGADCLSRVCAMFDFNGVPRLSKLAPPWILSSARSPIFQRLCILTDFATHPRVRSCTCIVASSQAPSSITRQNPVVRCASAAFHRHCLLFVCLVSPR
jgi:hypothetical protein